MKLPIILRAVKAEDINFIVSSWTTSYRESFFAKRIPTQIYFQEHRSLIAKFLGSSTALSAVNQEDENQILGFIVFDSNKVSKACVIHYLYVKSAFRNLGIATELLEEALHRSKYDEKFPIIVTHDSMQFSRFCKKVFVYDPYLIGDYL